MAILNINPSGKELIILQRNDTNTLYEEVHISGSLVIPYLDSDGHLNADDSSSFYSIFPPLTNISKKITNYTITNNDYTIIMSGSTELFVFLPTSSIPIGRVFNIKNISLYNLTVTGSSKIDDNINQIITPWNTLTIQNDGNQWYII